MGLAVLYLTGWCRSGSTVLGNTLAEVPGFFHAGELRFLWQNGLLGTGSNRRCGCGDDLAACPVWSSVLAAATPRGVTPAEHAADVVRWQRGCRTRHTWRVLRHPPRNGWPQTLAATYRAIAAHTGSEVVIDSSKFASDAALLRHLPGIRAAHVHLVRDPRAVALSWLRPKDYTGRRGPIDSTRHWLGFNQAAEAVSRAMPAASMRVRYEDFAHRPKAVVGEILRLAGRPGAVNPVREDGTVVLGANHTVTGNPNRFERGRTPIAEDKRWHGELTAARRAAITLLAAPQLARYGYARRP